MPLFTDQTLTAALKAAQHLDQQAYDLLYTHYAQMLYRYLYARCGDPSLADELTGELWLRVVEALPAFRIPDQDVEPILTGWLFRIARNLVIDHYRKHKRIQVPLTDQVPADDAAWDTTVEQQEEHEALYQALSELTPEQREIVMLRFFQGYTSAEVAALTGRSETSVKALQRRAVGSLLRLLGRLRHAEL
jgi:RNA polymerase sigma-70 factor, ECF subfamily